MFSGAKGGFTNLYKIDSDGRNFQQITTGDWADHYSQVAIYLRLNGLLPPTAKAHAE